MLGMLLKSIEMYLRVVIVSFSFLAWVLNYTPCTVFRKPSRRHYFALADPRYLQFSSCKTWMNCRMLLLIWAFVIFNSFCGCRQISPLKHFWCREREFKGQKHISPLPLLITRWERKDWIFSYPLHMDHKKEKLHAC